MTGVARSRNLRYVSVGQLPLRSLLLALFFVSGVLAGYVFALRCVPDTAGELRRYLDGYLSGAIRPLTAEAVVGTAWSYLRGTLLAFLLGFASVGVIGLPLLFTAQGFVLSFSLFAFALSLGRESFALLPVLFALRLLFVLPCTFLTGVAALEKSRALAALTLLGGRRAAPVVYGAAYWYRFAAVCVCLLIGSALELWLVPALLARFLS